MGESHPEPFDLGRLETSLPGAAERQRQWVLEASEDDMELILQIQVAASRDQVQIEGSVPVLVTEGETLVTTVQTSA